MERYVQEGSDSDEEGRLFIATDKTNDSDGEGESEGEYEALDSEEEEDEEGEEDVKPPLAKRVKREPSWSEGESVPPEHAPPIECTKAEISSPPRPNTGLCVLNIPKMVRAPVWQPGLPPPPPPDILPVDCKPEPELNIDTLSWEKKPKNPEKYAGFTFQEPVTGPSCEADFVIESPKSFFSLFFTNEFKEHIVYQTNLYGTQQNKKINFKLQELEAFLGMLIIMGFHSLPFMKVYWSQNRNFRVDRIEDIMSFNRFTVILQYLHLNDNTKAPKNSDPKLDKYYKVRPMMTYLNERFKLLYNPSRNLSIAESNPKCRAQISIPNRGGTKLYALCCSETGYALSVMAYTEKKKANTDTFVGETIVAELVRPFLNRGYCVYFNDFFSTMKLVCSLLKDDMFCCCSMKACRKAFPKGHLNGEDKEFDYVQTDDITVIKWHERNYKMHNVVSTIHNPIDKVGKKRVIHQDDDKQKKSKVKVIQMPTAVDDFKLHSRGVEKLDKLVSAHNILWRTSRWWMKLFYYFTDLAIVNSYILYKLACTKAGKTPMTHLTFRSLLADELIGKFRIKSRKGRAVSYSDVRFENVGVHFPVALPTKNRACAYCLMKDRDLRKKSSLGCSKCNVALCLECFRNYHTRKKEQPSSTNSAQSNITLSSL